MNTSQALFAKLVDPYHSTTQTAQLADLHSLFWQQLPEIAEHHARPQAKKVVTDLQKQYRQLLAFILYPQLAQTTVITVRGEAAVFLQALQLDWYNLPVPLFIASGAEQVFGLNLFQSPQTFALEEIAEIPSDFAHLLQHLLIQTPTVPAAAISFLLPTKQEQILATSYSLSFITDDNWDYCWQLIQQQQHGQHFLVNLSSHQFDGELPTHITLLPADNWLETLSQWHFESRNRQLLLELERQFLSYHHALELLLTFEHKQLAQHANEPLRVNKHQQQLKVLQAELALWQTFHQRFRRLIQTLPIHEQFDSLTPLANESGNKSLLQAYQNRTNRQGIGYENHCFEQLLLVQAKPLRSTPAMQQQFSEFLTTNWQLPETIAFVKPITIEEGTTEHETT